MADVTIFDLASKPTPVGLDEIEIQQTGGGASMKTTVGRLYDRANHTGTQAITTISGRGDLAVLDTVSGAEIDIAAVSLAKMADMASSSFLGRSTALTGVPEVLNATTVRSIINVSDGAEVNQNAFSVILVNGQSDVNADAKADSFTLVAGNNVTITTNPTSDSITIATSGGDVAVEDEGSEVVAAATTLNFVGTGVTASDAGGGKATVTIAGGAAPVDSVFTRTGVVVAQSGDYTLSQIGNVVLSSPIDKELFSFEFSTGNFINRTAAEAGLSVTGHTHLLSGVTDSGALAAKNTVTAGDIDANSVGLAEMADMATASFLGRNTAATGDPEVLAISTAQTMLNVADGSEVNQNAFSTVSVSGQSDVVADTKTDALTLVAGSNVTLTTDAGADSVTITAASGGSISVDDEGSEVVANATTLDFIGTGVTAADEGSGVVSVTIAGGAAPVDSVFTRTGTVVAEDGDYDIGELGDVVITSVGDDDVIAYDNGTSKFINQTASEAGLAAASHTHTLANVTDSGDLAALDTVDTTEIANNAVSLAKLADMATASFIGRDTTAAGDPEILSAADARVVLNVADGAEVNQNAFGAIAVDGQSNVVADVDADTFTLVAGSNITITTDAGTDAVTINSSASGSDLSIEDEGSEVVAAATILNFVGTGVSAADAGGNEVTITIAGGSAPVDSVFTRTGAVVAQEGDYNLDQLGDVVITTVGGGETLIYDNGTSKFINQTLVEAGIAATSHTHSLSDITDDGALAALDSITVTEIDDGAVSFAKITDVVTDCFIGRDTAGTGVLEILNFTAARSMLNVADGSTANDTDANLLARANHTGTQTLSTISDSGTLAALNTVGSTQIDNGAVGLTKLADMATASFVGRNSASTGDPEILNTTTARSMLNVADGSTANDTDANLLARANHTGTQTLATISDSGALAPLNTVGSSEITNNSVTLVKMADMNTASFIGRNTASTGDPEVLSATLARGILNVADGAAVNQNAFSTIKITGQTDVVADSTSDAFTLVAGTNITLTTNASTDEITIVAAGGSGMTDIVEDTSPELGGDLNAGGYSIYNNKISLNAKSANYTTVAGDTGQIVTVNSASTTTVTVHSGAVAGFHFTLVQRGTGQVTLAAGGTGAIRNYYTHTKLAGQYASASVWVDSNAGTAPQVYFAGATAT